MIINCINCNKKFDVDSSLIPEKGRTIQCSSCNHIWFFKPNLENPKNEIPLVNNENDKKINETLISQDQDKNSIEDVSVAKKKNISIKKSQNKLKKETSFSFGKFLSYILVFIISFIAMIIILDTFKSPLIRFFPSLELFLYNFFETIKDLYLFFKNLID